MIIIAGGIEAAFIGEPTPKEIHRFYVPELQIPLIEDSYGGEVLAMYRANGREFLGSAVCRPEISVATAVNMLGQGQKLALDRGGAVLGPFVMAGNAQVGSQIGSWRGIGVWGIRR